MTATLADTLPIIIQGGMGVAVSSWQLARAVSMHGQLGVVSGTCIDTVFVRRLQDGDVGGHMRRAMEGFPLPEVSAEALRKYFLPEGREPDAPYKLLSMWHEKATHARQRMAMLASYVEVTLAKEAHDGLVGMNLLTKVQLPNLATLYGAMLAGVDYVLMGAGIPKEIPGVLDAFAAGVPATMRLDVEEIERGMKHDLVFDPRDHFEGAVAPELKRPKFLPIVSSHSLATMLMRKSNGRVDGFVVEGPTAGGHNAPPRGGTTLDEAGEPVYGPRDDADLAAMSALGMPFWVAGGMTTPEEVQRVRDAGATGVQVGTLFAFSKESGLIPPLRDEVLHELKEGRLRVSTDVRASPTGFPFKVVHLAGTNAGPDDYQRRPRLCDLGYLRTPYRREDGRIGYRCPAEPIADFAKKGGAPEETAGRKCLCNGLLANIGHPQRKGEEVERPLLTGGSDLDQVREFAKVNPGYTATDVVDYLLGRA
jgi:nitronate monooxygenase